MEYEICDGIHYYFDNLFSKCDRVTLLGYWFTLRRTTRPTNARDFLTHIFIVSYFSLFTENTRNEGELSTHDMSTAFYSSSPPKLIASFHNQFTKRTLEVWNTTCIVTNFGKVSCSALINPANPDLTGVRQFPYFPRGGPVPKIKPRSMHADWQPLGYVTSWGGMEVGSGMLYPVSVVDGLVHNIGGTKLALECKFIQTLKGGCPTGQAVVTTQGSDSLIRMYPRIIHTSPPFYNDVDSFQSLKQCYSSSLTLAFSFDDVKKVACPLIGAGARGFPYSDAIAIASSQVLEWQTNERDEIYDEQTVAFGIPDPTIATQLVDALASNQ